MNKTEKRQLNLRNKLFAAIAMLLVSSIMMVSSTYAWFTLSTAPEVQGITTTIGANGNLEIALVNGFVNGNITDGLVDTGTLTQPNETTTNDYSQGWETKNFTWGNLVNLSDSAYGLDNLVLRPAMLNDYNLSTNPLYGPIYDTDGRVIDLNTSFGYSAWNADMLRFDYTTGFGVRAISSMTEGASSASKVYNEGLNKVNALNLNVQNEYEALAERTNEINALSSIIANYMAYSLIQKGSGVASMLNTPTVTSTNLGHLASMYEYAVGVMESQADAFAAFLNFEKTLSENNDEWDDITYVASAAEILARTDANVTSKTVYNDLKSKGYVCASNGFIQEIDQFILDYHTIKNDISVIREYQQQAQSSGDKLNWNDDLTALISNLVDMDKCKIIDENGNEYTVGGIGGQIALGLVGQTVDAYITNGFLLRFENRSGARLYAEKVKFSLSTKLGTQTINGNIMTSAHGTNVNYFENERANIAAIIEEKFGAPDLVANDTYGLALDMWVRTNAPGTYLTLQGNVLTETKTERVIGKDANGNDVEIWTITVATEGEGEDVGGIEIQLTQSYDIYQKKEKDDSGNELINWYYASNHVKVEDPLVYEIDENGERGALLAREKWEEVEYVIGYEGENRVWNGSAYTDLTVNSSTQGSGSCYVFYADPAEQLRTLTLLKAMKVAFVDENGELLATAFLDTDRHYAESGKVIVPLVLDPAKSKNAGTDVNGDTIYGITALEQNVPLRITSILYLDGNGLGNEDVLSASDIQGQLNIQFGCSDEMNAVKNENLYNSVIDVSAGVSKTTFNYDTDTDFSTKVSVNISGIEPKSVKAFFIREINASQGVREKVFELTETDEGVWTYDYTFDYPGTYILRTIQIDGTNYDLTGKIPRVVVEGFAIADVIYNMGEIIMSDKNTYSGDVMIRFLTNDVSKMPGKVQGSFVREDGTSATINFAYNPTTQLWVGTANFGSSGVYTMDYVTLDGRITPLGEGNSHTIDLKLGMRVNVTTSTYPTTFGSEDENAPKKLVMQVQILDNTGNAVVGLSNARLNYVNAGGAASTLETKLTWNQESECYEGELQVKEGIWKFNYVTVAMGSGTGLTTSTLTASVNNTPVFTIIPPEPPSMSESQPVVDMYQYVKGGDGVNTGATVSVNLDGATAATVVGKITKANGEVKYVLGVLKTDLEASEGDIETVEFEFILPEEGEWTLTEVYAWNVYGEKPAGAESAPFYGLPLKDGASESITTDELLALINDTDTRESTLATAYHVGETEATVAALYNVKIEINHKQPANGQIDQANKLVTFGKGPQGTQIQSMFMDAHTVNPGDITIEFKDDNDLISKGYFTVSGVTLGINYSKFSTDYGSYSSDKESTVQVQDALNFTFSGNIASLADTLILQYAAQYDMGLLTYTISDKSDDTGSVETLSSSVTDVSATGSGVTGFVYEVWSKAPTVNVTGITTGTINVHTGTRGNDGTVAYDQTISGNFNQKTDYSAMVFLAANNRNVTIPEVKLTISGMPSSGFTATMVFQNESNSGYNRTFEFTANNQEKSQKIGGGENGSGGILGFGATNPKIFPAGKQTVDQITVVYNGITFTVDLSHEVTINQPQYPRYVEFTIGNSAYPGNMPTSIYVEDGETVQIKLPDANEVTTTWTENKTDTTTSAFTEKSHDTTVYYETWNDDCDGAMYQQYDKHVIVSEAEETISTYVRTWKITGWKVGNTTYGLGETVTVTGSQTISAVLTSVDGTKTTTVNIITRTTKYYEVGADTTGNPPAGYTNVTADPDNRYKDSWTSRNPNDTDVRNPKN